MFIEVLKLDLIQGILSLKDIEILTQIQSLKEKTGEKVDYSQFTPTSPIEENPNSPHNLVEAIQQRFANIESFELPNISRDSLREPPPF